MSYDPETSKIITRAMGSLKEGIGQPLDNGQVGIVDPDARMIGKLNNDKARQGLLQQM